MAATDEFGRIIAKKYPYRGMRKAIGNHMLKSLTETPQGTVMSRIDMSEIIRLREEYKKNGISVSYTDIFIKVLASVIKEVPILNSTRDEKSIYVFETVNVGIAVMAGDMLIVPVITDVQNKTLEEIAKESADIISKTRAGQFDQILLDGATITLNNLGIFNIEGCTPIVNVPGAVIVAVGAIKKEAMVDENDNIVVRPVTTISITQDHSIMDGGPLGMALNAFRDIAKEPKKYL